MEAPQEASKKLNVFAEMPLKHTGITVISATRADSLISDAIFDFTLARPIPDMRACRMISSRGQRTVPPTSEACLTP
jgi:hypothetical protein